ncbi:Calpain-type cysteine protease DEK1 [Capsicum baccatum]|uniref:Calpain-type cysteine protease DEK1 n=1 Tax=Capsicum baccatum TaxID=33114 RepID=A0A2G2UYX5_CAPBA|nr:Calpain-type cysteine protease DEK1 [Capsicum baccatum]
MYINQFQPDLAATVRGNDILKCEVENTLDTLSYATPKLKYLELQYLVRISATIFFSSMSKSSVLLGLSLTVPLMVACLSIAIPIWIRNGYQFWSSRAENAGRAGNHLTLGMKEGVVLFISISLFAGSILALEAIVSAKPLDDLDYKGWTGGRNSVTSPYAIALVVTGVLPIISWFATYQFSLSSAICIGIFAAVIVAFCGVSYFEIVGSRTYQIPTKADFLASLLPLIYIPAVLSLGAGLFKWKDDNWKLSQGAYMFIIIGLLLFLGAISAIIVTIKPWAASVGASVGYFSFLFLVAGRALTVLLSPPIVVYSPRVLPVYVYDAHADCGKNVSAAFLVLYGIALAIEGWGVVASLQIYPPFAGAAVSAITLVVAFGFAVSRPCLTLEMVEDVVHFLSKETMVQAIARSATKTKNALSGTYSAPQRSASSAALLVGDPTMMRDRGGNCASKSRCHEIKRPS